MKESMSVFRGYMLKSLSLAFRPLGSILHSYLEEKLRPLS